MSKNLPKRDGPEQPKDEELFSKEVELEESEKIEPDIPKPKCKKHKKHVESTVSEPPPGSESEEEQDSEEEPASRGLPSENEPKIKHTAFLIPCQKFNDSEDCGESSLASQDNEEGENENKSNDNGKFMCPNIEKYDEKIKNISMLVFERALILLLTEKNESFDYNNL